MRIAIAGIATESSSFSPFLTRYEDFKLRRAEEICSLELYPFLESLPADVELLPLLQARAIPGGRVEASAYARLKAEFLERLEQALPLDGLYLDMHGAMMVEGLDDAEGDWYAAARACVGDRCLIAASYDLHGNLSPRITATLDLLSAYRTAPHIDVVETKTRTFSLLYQCLRQQLRPTLLWLPIPALLPGERSSTEVEPARSLYAALDQAHNIPGVLDASLLVGYVWADEPRMCASAVVIAEPPASAAAQAYLQQLGESYWQARQQCDFIMPAASITTSLQRIQDAQLHALNKHPVVLSDSGDNPTAGGVGDRVDVLRALQDFPALRPALVVGIADPAATAACYQAGVGADISLSVGAALAPQQAEALQLRGQVRQLADAEGQEQQAVLHSDGIDIVLCGRRRPFHYLADFRLLGLEPQHYALIVVKMGYLVPEIRQLASSSYLALSPGAVDQDVAALPYQRRPRPLYPHDADAVWTASSVETISTDG